MSVCKGKSNVISLSSEIQLEIIKTDLLAFEKDRPQSQYMQIKEELSTKHVYTVL